MIPVERSEIMKEGLYFIRCKERPDYFLCHEEPSMLVFRKHGYSKRVLVLPEKDIDKAIKDLKKAMPVITVWIEEDSEGCRIVELNCDFCIHFEKVKTIDVLLLG